MNERIQRALDGDLDRASLRPAEFAELVEAESAIDAVVRAIPVLPVPALGPAVLRRLEPRRPIASPARERAAWLWRPRVISLAWRPAYTLAAAVAAVAIFTATRLWTSRTSAADERLVLTRFVFTAPEAGSVALAGDFTDWKPAWAMTRSASGVWTVDVPLAPGVHAYSFVVDGRRWVPDPMAPAVEDGFGGVNSRLAVLRPDRRS